MDPERNRLLSRSDGDLYACGSTYTSIGSFSLHRKLHRLAPSHHVLVSYPCVFELPPCVFELPMNLVGHNLSVSCSVMLFPCVNCVL
jgi:hypothetical protein